MNKAQSDIEGIYGKGTVCMSEDKCLSLEPGWSTFTYKSCINKNQCIVGFFVSNFKETSTII